VEGFWVTWESVSRERGDAGTWGYGESNRGGEGRDAIP
jgi:hypothetical protein